MSAPFQDQDQSPLEVVSTDALQSIERAQIDTQIATARRYPRNILAVKQQMLSIATLDEETAAACFYTLPRAGKVIDGPSVRMAEIALSCYGNVKAGTRILSVSTGENPHAVVQAVVHDLEKNVAYSVEKRRRITGKRSKGGKPDEDDINLAVNAGSAIAFRDAVFKVVPGALVKACFEAAKKVAVGDVKSLAVKRDKVLDRLKKMGLTEDRIFTTIGVKKAEEIDLEKLETLLGLGTAIRDGMTLEEAFPVSEKETPKPIFNRAEPAASTEQAPPAPAGDAQPTQTPQAELASLASEAGRTFDEVLAAITAVGFATGNATTFDELPLKTAQRVVKSWADFVAKMQEGGGK